MFLGETAIALPCQSMFETPTYIVLDLPAPIAEAVTLIRDRYDPLIASLPVEITLAGSSGVDVIAPGQNQEEVLEILEKVGRRHLPIRTSFVGISRFSGTQVFWLRPEDAKPFQVLQNELIAKGIRFEESPFPYTPHCTLSSKTGMSAARERALTREAFPIRPFTLSRLSLYQLHHGTASRLRSLQFERPAG